MQKFNLDVKKIKDKGVFASAVITLIIVFMTVEFFAFGLISLQEYAIEQENSNQIIVYLNDLDEEHKHNFSKSLLELPGVNSIKYESKEVALRAAVIELGVEVDEAENPLKDAFFVYLSSDVELEKMKNSLINMPEISAIDLRSKSLETSINFSKGINTLIVKSSALFIVVGLFMVYNIVGFSIKSRKKEIHHLLEQGVNSKDLKRFFFFENTQFIIISTILSFTIYTGLKALVIENIKQIAPTYETRIFIGTEAIVVVIMAITAILISAIICFFAFNNRFKLEDYSEENEKTEDALEETTNEVAEEIGEEYEEENTEY